MVLIKFAFIIYRRLIKYHIEVIWYISGPRVTFIGILISLHSSTSSHYDTQAHSKCSSPKTCLLLNAHFQSNSRTPRTLSFKSFSIENMRSGNVLATPSFVEISNTEVVYCMQSFKAQAHSLLEKPQNNYKDGVTRASFCGSLFNGFRSFVDVAEPASSGLA